MAQLTQELIRHQMIEWRNLKRLHKRQQITIENLRAENHLLKERVAFLEARDIEKDRIIEDLRLQVEELRLIVFGKRDDKGKKQPVGEKMEDVGRSGTIRLPSSYQRTIPKEEEVTETRHHPLPTCPSCQQAVTPYAIRIYYEEDIPLPVQKTVVKHVVEVGSCCGKRMMGASLPSSNVVLGKNVERLVAYAITIARLSYNQTQELFTDLYGLAISQGEIAKLLEREGVRLRPEYERMTARIRGEPAVHLDETSWRIFTDNEYCRHVWGMVGASSDEGVFLVGRSRGKGVAEELYGNSHAVLVSDDYGAYRNLTQHHQLCWAHLHRKLRELAESSVLSSCVLLHCKEVFTRERMLYSKLAEVLHLPAPLRNYHDFSKALTELAIPHPLDPPQLSRIKNRLGKNINRYLTCLRHPGVPLDNNAAERALRPVVLKRKISFGSVAEKGARTLETLLSVLLTLKRRHPQNFFGAYAGV